MARLIDADVAYNAIKHLKEKYWHCKTATNSQFTDDCLRYIEKQLNKAPTIDAKPTRHGHWISHTFEEVMNGDWLVLSDWQGNGFECSNCGRLIAENKMAYKYKYCPNCGTKMDGDR